MEIFDLTQVPASLSKIAAFYGREHQSVVAIEELGELQKELCKMLRGLGNLEHLAEEIADVEIMLCQIKELYDIDPIAIKSYILVKTKRQLDRIENV